MSKINMKARPAMIIAARTIEPRGAGRLTPAGDPAPPRLAVMSSHGFTPTRRAFLAGTTSLAAAFLSARTLAQASTPHLNAEGNHVMSSGFIKTSDGTEIFFKDWGPKDAQPIHFHHGWPLSSDDWDNADAVSSSPRATGSSPSDRRGHGRSSQIDTGQRPWTTTRADASAVVEHLDLQATPSTSATRPAVARSPGTSRSTGSLRAASRRPSSSPPFRR